MPAETQFQRWSARRARWENAARKRPTLESSLLLRQYAAYAWYRLRFFVWLDGASIAAQLLQLMIFSHTFALPRLLEIVAAQTLVTTFHAYWWAVLEGLRQPLRDAHESRDPVLANAIVRDWVNSSLSITGVGLVGCLALFCWFCLGRSGGMTPFAAALASICYRGVLMVFLRTWHSAPFALRRIYRPFFATGILELAAALLAVVGWHYAGWFTFPLVDALTSTVSGALTLYYSRRAYVSLGLPTRFRGGGFGRHFRDGLRHYSGLALLFALARLQTVFLLAPFCFLDGNAVFWLVSLQATAPIYSAAAEWSRLFYFDLKKLRGTRFQYFREDFLRGLRRVAAVVAAVTWLIGISSAIAFAKVLTPLTLGMLLLAQLLRSFWSLEQIAAFARESRVVLFWMATPLLGALLLLAPYAGVPLLLISLFSIRRPRARGRRLVTLGELQQEISQWRSPCELVHFRLRKGHSDLLYARAALAASPESTLVAIGGRHEIWLASSRRTSIDGSSLFGGNLLQCTSHAGENGVALARHLPSPPPATKNGSGELVWEAGKKPALSREFSAAEARLVWRQMRSALFTGRRHSSLELETADGKLRRLSYTAKRSRA